MLHTGRIWCLFPLVSLLSPCENYFQKYVLKKIVFPKIVIFFSIF